MTAPLVLTIFDAVVFLAVVVPFSYSCASRRDTESPGAALTCQALRLMPARDEGAAIVRAGRIALAQDYPTPDHRLDDGSSDATGDVLRELAARDSRVVVMRVDDLPAGWLGKNHALWRGAESASGEWLLFTDADIVFRPDALRRAVGYAAAEGLDHLTLAPRLIARGILLRAFVAFFASAFVALWGAYLANDPKSKRGVGVGAFNLVRRSAYGVSADARALVPTETTFVGDGVSRFGPAAVLNGTSASVEWYPARRGISGSRRAVLEHGIPVLE